MLLAFLMVYIGVLLHSRNCPKLTNYEQTHEPKGVSRAADNNTIFMDRLIKLIGCEVDSLMTQYLDILYIL